MPTETTYPKCHCTAILTRTRKSVYECEDCGHEWPLAGSGYFYVSSTLVWR